MKRCIALLSLAFLGCHRHAVQIPEAWSNVQEPWYVVVDGEHGAELEQPTVTAIKWFRAKSGYDLFTFGGVRGGLGLDDLEDPNKAFLSEKKVQSPALFVVWGKCTASFTALDVGQKTLLDQRAVPRRKILYIPKCTPPEQLEEMVRHGLSHVLGLEQEIDQGPAEICPGGM